MGFAEDGPAKGTAGPAIRSRKQPKQVTVAYLERAALHYLQRYSSTESNLRRILTRKVYRSCHYHGLDPTAFAAMVEAVIARKIASGLVDDKRFAENRVANLKRIGTSGRMIGAKLTAKGVTREVIAQTNQIAPDDETSVALVAAQRKRLGPWRTRGVRTEFRQKDIAVLMRAGFSGSVARAVIDGNGQEVE